jgi:hypothetical protein
MVEEAKDIAIEDRAVKIDVICQSILPIWKLIRAVTFK